MPRRYRPDKRVADPDPRYNDRQVQSFINRVMKNGKKSTATAVVYGAFEIIEEKAGKPGLEVFKAAMKEVSPVMEVRPRRVGGATYQVPMEVDSHRQFAWPPAGSLALPETAVENRFQKNLRRN
jgi:small subunit ribosomal protein S7